MEYMSTEIRSAREALTIFKILGIKDVTTDRQRSNGTTVYELPIEQMWSPDNKKNLRFATYSTGYVRNVTENLSSPYQINQKEVMPAGTNGHSYSHSRRILIPNWEDRLIYLAKYIVKNYYQKTTYLIGDYTMNYIKEQFQIANEHYHNVENPLPWAEMIGPDSTPVDDVQVIINGHRYNLS